MNKSTEAIYARQDTGILSKISWILAYFLFVLAPVLLLIIFPAPTGISLAWDFSIAVGMSLAVLLISMFVLTARFRRATAPFGIDLVYYFHRQIALLMLVLGVLHVLLLIVAEPMLLMEMAAGEQTLMLGIAAMLCITILTVTSLWRRNIAFKYEEWRIAHIGFAVAAVVFVYLHMYTVDYYVSATSQQLFWIGLLLAWIIILLYVRWLKPLRLQGRPFQLTSVKQERGKAWTITLSDPAGQGVGFLPGQFAWLSFGSSPLAAAEHPFSIACSAQQRDHLQFTIKELGDFTRTVKHMQPGLSIYVDGPYGVFSIDRHSAPGYVFIAGGIGIVPIMSMLRTLADRCDQRPLLLIYAYKSPEYTTYKEELALLQPRLNLDIEYVYSEPPADWKGEVGYINTELLKRHMPDGFQQRHFFVCGPTQMMLEMEADLSRLGIVSSHIHSELFNLV